MKYKLECSAREPVARNVLTYRACDPYSQTVMVAWMNAVDAIEPSTRSASIEP